MERQSFVPEEAAHSRNEQNSLPTNYKEYVRAPGSVFGLHSSEKISSTEPLPIRDLTPEEKGSSSFSQVAKIGSVEYGVTGELGSEWQVINPESWLVDGQWHSR
jgi:hypothetical protein